MHTLALNQDRSDDLGCWIQAGVSSWDKDHGNEGRQKSVRCYYENRVGGFSRQSPEAPISWIMPMVLAAVESKLAALTINGKQIPTEVAIAFLGAVELVMDDSPTQTADGARLTDVPVS
jgi:hypothetical protein